MNNTFYRLNANPEGGMQPSNLTAVECFSTHDHTETVNMHFETDDESITVGVWEITETLKKFYMIAS